MHMVKKTPNILLKQHQERSLIQLFKKCMTYQHENGDQTCTLSYSSEGSSGFAVFRLHFLKFLSKGAQAWEIRLLYFLILGPLASPTPTPSLPPPPHPELIRNKQQPVRCIKGRSGT